MLRLRLAVALAPALVSFFTAAADDPAPRQRMWIAKDFKFHTGEAMAELKPGHITATRRSPTA